MKPIEITIVISPADLAPWNGAEVPVRFVFTETGGTFYLPPPPHLSPEVLKQLRVDYAKIASHLTEQSQEIFWFLLNTSGGQATRQELMKHVWPNKFPTYGAVRQAVAQLRQSLIRLKFGCIVSGSRSGVYSIVLETNGDSKRK